MAYIMIFRNRFSFSLVNLCIIWCIFSFVSTLHAQEDIDEFVRIIQDQDIRLYEQIQSLKYKAHVKSYFYVGFNPLVLSMVPYLEEYYADGVWTKPDSIRLTISALRVVTAGDQEDTAIRLDSIKTDFPLPNPMQFSNAPSLFGFENADDNPDHNENDEHGDDREENEDEDGLDYVWPVFPFEPGADSLYDYEILGEIITDYSDLYEISVTPKRNEFPGVVGVFQVDKNNFNVTNFSCVFNEFAGVIDKRPKGKKQRWWNSISISIPFSQNHTIQVQKVLYHNEYWLPYTIDEEFDIALMGLKVRVHRTITFDSYEVDADIESSFHNQNQQIVYARDKTLEKEIFNQTETPNTLTNIEEEELIKAIEDRFLSEVLTKELIDSDALAQAVMLKNIEGRGRAFVNAANKIGSVARYNRVEGAALGYGITFALPHNNNTVLALKSSYGFEDQHLKGEASLVRYTGAGKKSFLEGSLYSKLGFDENRSEVPEGRNTLASLVAKRDYRDYYYKQGGSLGFGYRINEKSALKIQGFIQKEKRAAVNAKFSIFNNNDPFRINPAVVEGLFTGVRASFLYKTYMLKASLTAEYADDGLLSGDFSYGKVFANLSYTVRQTRNTRMRFNLTGGVSDGELPPQKWFDFGGKLPFQYYGRLRGIDYKTFTGDKAAYGTIEYSVNGSVLSNVGLEQLFLQAIKTTFWTSAGKSTLTDRNRRYIQDINVPSETTDSIYYEYGIGIGDRFNVFRVDFVHNSLHDDTVRVNFNIFR